MPQPIVGESEKEFISRCIPIVLKDGTTQDEKQAAAICYSKWEQRGKSNQDMPQIITQNLTRLTLALAPKDATGHAWDVTIIGPDSPADVVTIDGTACIRSKNNRYFQIPALQKSIGMFDGAKVYDDHLTDAEFRARSGMRSTNKDWLGSITDAKWDDAAHSMTGVFHVVDDSFAAKSARANEQQVINTIGLSMDVFQDGYTKVINGQPCEVVTQIKSVNSVDVVGSPAAGGKFNRLLESVNTIGGITMKDMMSKLDALAAAVDASALGDADKQAFKAAIAGIKADCEKEMKSEVAAGTEAPAGGAPEGQSMQMAEKIAEAKIALLADVINRQIEAAKFPPAVSAPDASKIVEANDILAKAQEAQTKAEAAANRIIEAAKVAEAKATLRESLSKSGLTPKANALIEKQFSGRVFEAKELTDAIDAQREIALEHDTTGNVKGHGTRSTSGMVIGMDQNDNFSMSLLRLMAGNRKFDDLINNINGKKNGVEIYSRFNKSPLMRSINAYIKAGKPALNDDPHDPLNLREWYRLYSDGDLGGTGEFGSRAIEANQTTSTLSSLTKNALNVLIAADYSVRQEWWNEIVYEEDVDTIDAATLVRVFGISTLPIVPEGDPYLELSFADEEETATFFKRGGFVGITLETFLKSRSLPKLQEIPTKLANAWYNTLSARVAGVFTTNSNAGPALSDGGALFNATAVSSTGGHANLLTTALAHAAWDAVVTAMMKQTDQPLGAGSRLGMENKPTHMLVPINLRNSALEILNSDYVPGFANLTANQYKGDFKIVVVPEWTDANDWGAISIPSNGMSPIHMIYLRGKRTPELFTADAEENGAMFSNDTLRYKVRQFNAEFSSTYACSPVADWRSLHKSNVT